METMALTIKQCAVKMGMTTAQFRGLLNKEPELKRQFVKKTKEYRIAADNFNSWFNNEFKAVNHE